MKISEDEMREAWLECREYADTLVGFSYHLEFMGQNLTPQYYVNWFDEMQGKYGDFDE